MVAKEDTKDDIVANRQATATIIILNIVQK